MRAIVLAWLALASLLAPGVLGRTPEAAAISAPSGIDSRLRLEWEAGTGWRGHTVVRGYVYNDYGRPAVDVRLLIETLDDSGLVVDRTIGFVTGAVPFNDRTYFEVPLKRPGSSYRVTVTSFDWRAGGGP